MDETLLDPSILSGLNSTYIADLYEKWLDDPNNVDSNWRGWFENLKLNGRLIITKKYHKTMFILHLKAI